MNVLDHILSYCLNNSNSGVIIPEITDHYPVYCTVDIIKKVKPDFVKFKYRSRSNTNKENFLNQIAHISWNDLLIDADNVNDMFTIFNDELLKHYNNCFPIKTKMISTKRLSKPWLSSGILKSIKSKHNKHRLYK